MAMLGRYDCVVDERVGIRCFAVLWLLKVGTTTFHAVVLWTLTLRIGGPPWTVNQLIVYTAAIKVSWGAIIALAVFYYLMYKGVRLQRVIARKTAGCTGDLYVLKLFAVILALGLCLRGAYVVFTAPVQLLLLNLSSQWQSAEVKMVRELNVQCVSDISDGIISSIIGVIVYIQCGTIVRRLQQRLIVADRAVTESDFAAEWECPKEKS